MIKFDKFQLNIFLILLSSVGGFIFSFTGSPISWLLGSLIIAWLACTIGARWIKLEEKGMFPSWRQIGQAILGIQLGQNINVSIIDIFKDHFIIITIALLITILISILSGILLWRFSSASMMTCLLASTPGGISAMPAIADEEGANGLVVTFIQTLRILLVVGILPFIANILHSYSEKNGPIHHLAYGSANGGSLFWTTILITGACVGALIAKKVKTPAPWLIGSMLGVAFIQLAGTFGYKDGVKALWSHNLIIIAQVLIGASIGSRVSMKMFKELGSTFIVSIINTLSFVALICFISAGISEVTGMPLVTCILAFAPGGVAEMAATAIALHVDSTFVVAVQTFRLLAILILLPPLFRFINSRLIINSRHKESTGKTY